MKRRHTHLTQEQRYQIYRGLRKGYTQQTIADIIGVHKSTISRELRRNQTPLPHRRRASKKQGRYQPRLAHQRAQARRVGKTAPRLSPEDWAQVEVLLQWRWSPEQISLRMARDQRMRISHEWIYRYIRKDKDCGGSLYRFLRCQKQRRKRYGSGKRHQPISNRVSIEQRPIRVELRDRIGDFELDTVYGKNHTAVMLTAVERKSRYVFIDIMPCRNARVLRQSLVRMLNPLRHRVHTLTADNGAEFAEHQSIAKALNADFYFAHPYASWERGTNENTNGLIRQYFPKGCDLATVTTTQLATAVQQLNNRPRKCLDMKTPNQVLFGIEPEIPFVALQG